MVDANVFVDLFLTRASAFHFFENLSNEDELLSTLLLMPESTSVIRTQVFDARAEVEDASLFIRRLLDMPSQVVADMRQVARGFELATRFQRRNSYDMQYLAVAEITGSTLVTRDRGIRHAASGLSVPVTFLA